MSYDNKEQLFLAAILNLVFYPDIRCKTLHHNVSNCIVLSSDL